MGSTAEQTLIGFISVDNNAHRLCNLCADLPEERLNGKIPALKPAGLLCSAPSVWTPNFLVECLCTLYYVVRFQLIFPSLKQSLSYTFLWAYGISAIKSTCSHFVVHLVRKNIWIFTEVKLSGFYQTRRHTFLWLQNMFSYFLIQTLEVCWSN